MRMGGAPFLSGILVRLSPDSARTKNAITKIIASQKIPRTAFNLFILLFLLLRASVLDFLSIETEPRLTLCDSVPAMLHRSFQKRQAESLAKIDRRRRRFAGKSNGTVTRF